MTSALSYILVSTTSFVAGMFALLGYMIFRLMQNVGWDKSNLTNALRVLSHIILHPLDFTRMFYLNHEQLALLIEAGLAGGPLISNQRPFWYVGDDELSEVVGTRSPSNSVTSLSVTDAQYFKEKYEAIHTELMIERGLLPKDFKRTSGYDLAAQDGLAENETADDPLTEGAK